MPKGYTLVVISENAICWEMNVKFATEPFKCEKFWMFKCPHAKILFFWLGQMVSMIVITIVAHFIIQSIK